MSISWKELWKVKLASSKPELDKHDVVKLLILRKIRRKYSNNQWVRCYTEFPLENGLIPDIYFENVKEKSIIVYEIQKEISKKYIEEKTKAYNDYQVPYFNSIDLVIIPLKELSDNIPELIKQLDKYII